MVVCMRSLAAAGCSGSSKRKRRRRINGRKFASGRFRKSADSAGPTTSKQWPNRRTQREAGPCTLPDASAWHPSPVSSHNSDAQRLSAAQPRVELETNNEKFWF